MNGHTHRRPLHRLRKRPTFRNHISAKRRERAVEQRLAQTAGVSMQAATLPELPVAPIDSAPIVGTKPLEERQHSLAEDLHDWILGGQDGLVNVLGSILGVAIVTTDKYLIIVAGLASLFAECISLAAVAYTSVKAGKSYYDSQREERRRMIEENPVLQREILIDVYERKGMSRQEASRIVAELTKDKEVWLKALMEEHLRMYPPEGGAPLRSALIVGMSAFIGSIIPLLPFIFLTGMSAILTSIIISIIALFGAGAASAKLTIGDWKKRGAEMAVIGMTAALISFAIGFIFMKKIGV